MKKTIFAMLIVTLIVTIFSGCAKTEDVAGGYTRDRKLSDEDIAIFEEALANDSNKYELLTVATQVVAGTNYRFYVKELSTNNEFYIFVYVSLNAGEKPSVTEITAIE